MYCSNCGKEITEDIKFCYNCGNSVNEQQVSNKKGKNKNEQTSLVWGIICIVSAFFLNIICFIPGIISIVYAKKYKKEGGNFGVGFGLSLAGMIYSFIMFLIYAIIFLFFVVFVNSVNNDINNDYNYNYNETLENLSKI